MDTKEIKSLDSLIERFVNWRGKGNDGANHYSGEEFLEILEEMLKKENEHKQDAIRHQVRREIDIHNYAITLILEPLIGKMKYGKRI